MKLFQKCSILLFLLFFTALPIASAAQYKIDLKHSAVSFKIRHLLSKTQGFFRQFEGNLVYEEGKPETWSVTASIDPASIDTNVEGRDDHLRSADFFDVKNYPELTFKSEKITDANA